MKTVERNEMRPYVKERREVNRDFLRHVSTGRSSAVRVRVAARRDAWLHTRLVVSVLRMVEISKQSDFLNHLGALRSAFTTTACIERNQLTTD